VIREAGAGDEVAAQRRLDALKEIPPPELNPEALSLAGELVQKGPIPEKSKEHALHIALAYSTWDRLSFDMELSSYRERRNAEGCSIGVYVSGV
jgi:hypothetical protein